MRFLKRAAACLCAIAMLYSTALADVGEGNVTPFPDVPEDAPYADAVRELCLLGIMQGDDRGNFNPGQTLSRAEAAAVVCRLIGMEDEAGDGAAAHFSDVPATHWAAGYVAVAVDQGIINGYGNGAFGPTDPVTYEQIIKMLVCSMGFIEEAEAAGGWPDGYLAIARDLRLLDGMEFDQKDPAPRSAVALMAYHMTAGG